MPSADFDRNAARVFLELLFADLPGFIEVRTLAEGIHAEQTFAADIAEALAAIEDAACCGRNVYVGVATRRTKGDGSKGNLAAVRAFWIDRDFKAEGDNEAHAIALEGFTVPPSLRIFSGGGEHDYWLLEEPILFDDAERVEDFEMALKGIAHVLEGDRSATDASRILRVPGTVNVLDAGKRARGRKPAQACILETSGHLYQPEEFADLADRGRALARSGVVRVSACAADGARIGDGARNATLTSLAGTMRRRGMSEEGILAALTAENAGRCEPPLPGDEVQGIARSVSRYAPAEGERNQSSRVARDTVSSEPRGLEAAAFHGPAGEFVRLVEPHSESDPAALLVQFLVAFGSLIGRARYFSVEANRHYANLFAVIVGKSSKARKGTSKAQVLARCGALDDEWARRRVLGGLSSGEGLIWAVRDAIVKREPIKKSGVVTGYQDVETDPGIEDKRLLADASEFASVLRMMAREGNVLSAVIRDAWDRGDLRTLTKNNAAVATGAHVSILGHVTSEELRAELTRTDAANGFGNRFLWVYAKRSKLLPEGGDLASVDFGALHRDLARAADFARIPGEIRRDGAARERWAEIYAALSEAQPGLFGAITSRSEAQVARLALVYALLDSAGTIQRQHLEAALAVWRYCEASAAHVFGDAMGDAVADEILRALRGASNGLTRTEIREHFARNRRADEIERALGLLSRHGRAEMRPEKTTGRPAERWLAVGTYAVDANAAR